MKRQIAKEKYYYLINHGPTVLITSGDEQTKNIVPIAWLTPVNDDPPLVGICIAADAYTNELIKKTREFVINLPSEKLFKEIEICGSVSGRDIDKFAKTGLTPEKGKTVKTVNIKECIGYIECSFLEEREYEGVSLFVADVLAAYIDEDVFDGHLISEKAKTVHHLGGKYFMISGKRIKV